MSKKPSKKARNKKPEPIAENSDKTASRANSLKAIEPFRFKPGQSGNPGGRPKDLISDASKDWLKRIDPSTGMTNAELIAEAQGKVALTGDTSAYCAIRDTTEGRPAQKVTIDGSGTTDHTQRAREIIAAGLERLAGRSGSL